MNRNDKEFLVEKIRSQYAEKEDTALDALKKLDTKVKGPANWIAYIIGSIGAIIMGSGMSLVMTDMAETLGIAQPMTVGIIIGLIGLLLAVINYPLYQKILVSRRKKYADQIFALSEQIMKQ